MSDDTLTERTERRRAASGPANAARWATVAAFFLNGTVFGVWATQIPLLKNRLDLSAAVLGVALLFLAAGALTAMVASGPLLSRLGSAPVTRVTALLFAALLPLPALVPDVPALCLVLALFGAAGGTMDVAMNAQGALVERRLGRPIMSSLHGMWSLGGLAGAALGGLLLPLMPAAAQAGLVSAALLVLFLALQGRLLPDRSGGGGGLVLPDRRTLLLGTLAALSFMSEGAILDWSAIHLRDDLGAPQSLAGLGFGLFCAAMAAGRFSGDRLRQRFGGATLMRSGAVVAAAGLGLVLLGGSPLAAMIGFGVTGLGLSNVVPVLFSTAGAVEGGRADHAVAAVSTMGYAGVLAGPPLVGFIAQATSLATAFALIALLALVQAAAAARAVPPRH
ncbi:MFS transporter [Azospirillum picis]|uniref:MFS family arabinose efflux permease n=1 Tax=Azospirillum picis TaxID=488438 RepID=A0ABU0MK12_9PROT|nr:MFS transporter [Azospirillum picis]MBP2299965.1 putative MFS family arabinose efflux permease [Azospirillum picis]MDQ0533797.1 putative MFS family arabinose efflux permease [Azospirillum picis]